MKKSEIKEYLVKTLGREIPRYMMEKSIDLEPLLTLCQDALNDAGRADIAYSDVEAAFLEIAR